MIWRKGVEEEEVVAVEVAVLAAGGESSLFSPLEKIDECQHSIELSISEKIQADSSLPSCPSLLATTRQVCYWEENS